MIASLTIRAACADEKALVFETDIQPVLHAKCSKCHSEKVRKGALDLSSIASLQRGGESEEPLLTPDIDDSLLWNMIDGGDMPPEGEPPLTDAEKRRIQQWLTTGGHSSGSKPVEKRPLHQHDILPIVHLRCVTCHGPQRQDGGVDLRTKASMLRGGNNGTALVPGDASASLMMQRIESQACPPTDLLLKFFVRRPPDSEVLILREWIQAGAPEADIVPDVATSDGDPEVTDDDRQHWSFQPAEADLNIDSLDHFVQQGLSERNLAFSPEADRDTLIRRVFLDLTGIPPTLNELHQWRANRDKRWYSQMVDSLLSSPAYGERWGRFWLDLAGYADSEGGISADPIRPVAWKYRDYVIRAFNEDKPYDRFLVEQLAGDELIDYAKASEISAEIVDNLIATGFLRMGIDETGSRTMNFVPERIKVISDALSIVSSGLMGVTMECARCHSHKYDPIPHRDYYRFKAIFQGALDEHNWHSFKTRNLNIATDEHRQMVAKVNPPLEASVKRFRNQKTSLEATIRLDLLASHYPQQSEEDNKATLAALKVADNNRSLKQRRLVEKLVQAELLADSKQPPSIIESRQAIRDLEREIDKTRRQMAPPLAIRALWDLGEPSPTYVLRRGEHNRSGRLVGPGVPSMLTDGKTPFIAEPPFPGGSTKTGRRLAFARWLTSPDNPLTSRVIVNRIWHHHFGVGLVKDLGNFGRQGEAPSHPRLLDWLAVKFVDEGWSIKTLHREVMNSRTYRQASRVDESRRQLDPQNRFLSRMPLRRMDAETLRDSLLAVAGRLDMTSGGIPDTVSIHYDGLVSVNTTDSGDWRRSVYLQYRRTEIPTLMDTFDYPQMGPNCAVRNISNVSPQALMLLNNGHVRQLADDFAGRVESLLADSANGKSDHDTLNAVQLVYELALSRRPTDEELLLGNATLIELGQSWENQSRKALTTYCHTILNSAAFIYVD
jgi:hypothetical protein